MFARHGVLTPGTVTTVDVPGSQVPQRPRVARLEVVNRNAAGELWLTTDGTVPSVAGNDVNVIPAVMGSFIVDGWNGMMMRVQLVSDQAVAWSIQVG